MAEMILWCLGSYLGIGVLLMPIWWWSEREAARYIAGDFLALMAWAAFCFWPIWLFFVVWDSHIMLRVRAAFGEEEPT